MIKVILFTQMRIKLYKYGQVMVKGKTGIIYSYKGL